MLAHSLAPVVDEQRPGAGVKQRQRRFLAEVCQWVARSSMYPPRTHVDADLTGSDKNQQVRK